MPRLTTLALLLTLPAIAQTTPTPRPYTALYVFGDSYSDIGAGFPYADGPTAVAYLAQLLHIPFTYYGDPAGKNKSLDLAVSAAKTGSDPGIQEGPHALFRLGRAPDPSSAWVGEYSRSDSQSQNLRICLLGTGAYGFTAAYSGSECEVDEGLLFHLVRLG